MEFKLKKHWGISYHFISLNVPTFLPNYTINKKSFSISSIKSLELLLKYRVNIIEPYNININFNNNNNNTTVASSSSFSLKNSNSNNYTITVALAFSLKNSYSKSNNNTTTTAPEPTTFSLQNSNSNYNLNSISEYSNLNNNSISLARSASCSSNDSNGSSGSSSSSASCNSNDSNGSSGCNNKNKKLKSPIYILLHLKTLNIGNIQETLDKFSSNRADYPKITKEVIKKCLKYSNIEDLEKLFREISTYSAGTKNQDTKNITR
ncbi:hypothetical protein DICPUDRAFT_81799 [Dictyostelium purpureum]|uniref:Uncharacterized protein n=1 Tax=Dictyostelium purpureum TaxID=5786 RepID=F0ZUM0_DICPU|nr:uncharacterized protein DICPUDRAFT_81799 [Dictyostelium purpureum]EGC32357.1 hypothetical protein DICPUDRAFT_81799 [Dictyostelium purpureum]|eukprot:XP_003291122.1 hypothetical protein DICPUDRAFT_81799 [Dictyostelium purpureum]